MSAKTEIGNLRLYLFWSLLKIPRFFSITGNCKQKIWLKQRKAALALDFSYFQHVSKLVTHHKEPQPKGCGSFFLVHDLGTFDAEKLHLRFRRIRFTPKFTPIKSFTP